MNYLEGNQLRYKIKEFSFRPKEVVLVEENKSQDAFTTNLYLSPKGSLFSNNDFSNNDLRIEPEAYTASIEHLNDEFFSSESESNAVEVDLNQSMQDISESCNQLRYANKKMQESLQFIEKELEETILTLQDESTRIRKSNQNVIYEVKKKEEEIATLKNYQNFEPVVIEVGRDNNGSCISFKSEIQLLHFKIDTLKKENIQLMDTILPYPELDKILLRKLKEKNKGDRRTKTRKTRKLSQSK